MPQAIHSGRYFTLMESDEGVEYVASGDEVIVVAVDEADRLMLISEPSAAFGEWCWLLPCGMLEAGESVTATANRELQEEVGLAARSMARVGELRAFSKYLDTRTFVCVGRELESSSLVGDEAHEIERRLVDLRELPGLVRSGEIQDARVIAALCLSGVLPGG